jgi:hypothetical protein
MLVRILRSSVPTYAQPRAEATGGRAFDGYGRRVPDEFSYVHAIGGGLYYVVTAVLLLGLMGGLVYRGVHANHPAIADARVGIARPGNLNGLVTPLMHNSGGHSTHSPYTSWTHNRDVAVTHARKCGLNGGVILEANADAPTPGAQWNWEYSPDRWLEQEVLLKGVRMGLSVTHL